MDGFISVRDGLCWVNGDHSWGYVNGAEDTCPDSGVIPAEWRVVLWEGVI